LKFGGATNSRQQAAGSSINYANLLRRHYLFTIAISLQLVALLIGFVIFYTCPAQGINPLSFSEVAYWGTIGILGFAFVVAIPLTVIVIALILIFIMVGASWKRVRFLLTAAFVLWDVYWVFLAHIICSSPPD
jgi:hypothetical protein